MTLEIFTLYVIAIFFVIMIPGPLSLFMVSNSVKYGILKSYPAFLGGTLASSVYLVASATGLGALITASDKLFALLKIAGAIYLFYLGWQTIKESGKSKAPVFSGVALHQSPGFAGLFKKAFLLGISNPKDIIFFMAFLPQFISAHGNLSRQIFIIVITWIFVDMLCKIIYGLLAKSIRPVLTTRKHMARFDKSAGALYIVAGGVSVVV